MKDFRNILHIKQAVLKIADDFNENNINWAIGGSLLLYFHDIVNTVNDIDIVIDVKNIDNVIKVLSLHDYSYETVIDNPNSIYKTEHFITYTVNGVDIDLLIGFKVMTDKGLYTYPTGDQVVESSYKIDGVKLNLCSLDDWKDAYLALGRLDKYKLLQ